MRRVLQLGLFALAGLFIFSCESEGPIDSVNPPDIDSVPGIISHYLDLNNYEVVLGNGDSVRLETIRLRDTVKIFLDSTVPITHKNALQEMIDIVEKNIQGSGVKFVFVEDTSDISIGIVNGSKKYLYERFSLPDYSDPPSNFLGAYLRKEMDCNTIKKGFIWYESGVAKLLLHEFGHAIGLNHATNHFSIMHHLLSDPLSTSTLSKKDISVLKLKYYDGALGITVPEYLDSCNDDRLYMYPSEEEGFKAFLESVILNNYK